MEMDDRRDFDSSMKRSVLKIWQRQRRGNICTIFVDALSKLILH
jgi:hypothetical protein